MNNVFKNILGATVVAMATTLGLGVYGTILEKKEEKKTTEFKMFNLKAEQ